MPIVAAIAVVGLFVQSAFGAATTEQVNVETCLFCDTQVDGEAEMARHDMLTDDEAVRRAMRFVDDRADTDFAGVQFNRAFLEAAVQQCTDETKLVRQAQLYEMDDEGFETDHHVRRSFTCYDGGFLFTGDINGWKICQGALHLCYRIDPEDNTKCISNFA